MMLHKSLHLTVMLVIFWAVMLLCFLDAALIGVSLLLVDPATISPMAIYASATAALVFLAIGLWVFRLGGTVRKLCRQAEGMRPTPELSADLRSLMASLSAGSLILGVALALIALVFWVRIGEGFAIFG